MVSGTELTKANLHTADGISVRFPRVTKIRDDKDWKTATNLEELKHLYVTSKEKVDLSLLQKLADTAEDDEPPTKKIKTSPKPKKSPSKPSNVSPKTSKIDSFFDKKPKIKKLKEETSPDTPKPQISEDDKDSKKVPKVEKMSLDEVDSKEFLFELDDPLPDVFKDKRLGFYPDFISFDEEERFHFERHWIAYGGQVVKSIRSMDVDYVLHANKNIDFDEIKKLKKKVPAEARHVYKDWLMQSINDVKLCDTSKYPVFIKPPR